MDKKEKEKLIDEIEQYNEDDEVIALYSNYTREELERNTLIYEARQEGIREGIREGIEQGIEQKTKESAINFYKNGVSKELIMTSLNIDEDTLNKYLEEE